MSLTATIILSIILLWIAYSIYELTNLHRFNIRFYSFGLTIFKIKRNVKFSNWTDLQDIYEMKEGRYVFIPKYETGFFVSQFHMFRMYSIFYSSFFPITIFGNFKQTDNELEIEYKISFRIVLLICLWLLPWIIFPIFAGSFLAIGLGIAGILFTSFMLFLAHFFKQGIMLKLSDEIEEILKIK